jgi:hypothetical protein
MVSRRGVAVACAATAAAAVLPASASAEETTCRGSLGAVTVDNLRVPQNGRCILTGTRVQGTIKVERAGTLGARGVRVIGNLQAENAGRVNVIQGSRGHRASVARATGPAGGVRAAAGPDLRP